MYTVLTHRAHIDYKFATNLESLFSVLHEHYVDSLIYMILGSVYFTLNWLLETRELVSGQTGCIYAIIRAELSIMICSGHSCRTSTSK
jgi:hypothetical protein